MNRISQNEMETELESERRAGRALASPSEERDKQRAEKDT